MTTQAPQPPTQGPSQLARWLPVVVASVISLAAGIGIGVAVADGDDDSTDRTNRTASQEQPREVSDSPSTAPASVEPNVGDDALEVGEPRVGSAITTTVLEVDDNYRQGSYVSPEAGFGWLGVNVKMCITGDLGEQPAEIGWYIFEAGTTDGATYPASGSSWDDFPSPQFPTSEALRSGCRQGWLLISVPKGEPVNVIRMNGGLSGGETVAEWTF